MVAGVATAIAVLGVAGVASAHVTVNPKEAPQGGYTKIAFRVPDESDTASTTRLDVYLPADTPVASVLTAPVPGWTAKLITTKLPKPITTDDGDQVTEAITQITWTAASPATAVRPGQFQEFPVSLGPLPTTGSMTFKVLQTYSDGSVVRWIDLRAPGGAEPAHPAPVLKLTPPSSPATAHATSTANADSGSSDTASLAVAIIAGVIALAGLALAALALRRGRPAS